jgi:hypothetical protein
MKVPVATSDVRSASASISAAGGGGNTNGKMKNPSATPKPVPNRPPIRKMMKPRQNLRMGTLSDRAFDGEEYAQAAANVTPLNPHLAAGGP